MRMGNRDLVRHRPIPDSLAFGLSPRRHDLARQLPRVPPLIERHFDLRPASIISALELRQPIYRQTAAYGHFGRPDLDLPWERTDKAGLLASDAGLPEPVGTATA